MTAAHAPDYEVLVTGGGLAGACAAALLAQHAGIAAPRIALLAADGLESNSPAATPKATPGLRVVAISRASERVLRAARAWDRLPAGRACAYERMRVWHESVDALSPFALCFDAADIGEPNLGYIIESDLLQRACLTSFQAAGGTLLADRLEGVLVEDKQVRVQTASGGELTARLLVGADGAQSRVRAHLPIAMRRRDYHQQAVVAVVRTALAHQNTAWQRFLHTGPLALLPLFDGSCGIVWSLDEPRGTRLCECGARQFSEQLDAASALVLGATRLISERRCFALMSGMADSYVAPRCALIGDAAHVIHPLAGQGANLGLLDAAALCEMVALAVAHREDPGALRALRGYEQQRRTHNLIMDGAMSAFHWGFAAGRSPGAWLVNRGLGMVNRSAIVKRWFARQALGSGGELPRMARAANASAT